MLYLIKSGKYIKIGFTDNMIQRYKTYINDNPNIEVLGLREGDLKLENTYHNILKRMCFRSEWFELPDYITTYLQTHHFTIPFNISEIKERTVTRLAQKEKIESKLNKYKYENNKLLTQLTNLENIVSEVPNCLLDIYALSYSEFKQLIKIYRKIEEINPSLIEKFSDVFNNIEDNAEQLKKSYENICNILPYI